MPCVVTDDVEGGRIATRYLVSLGHERVAFIGEDPDNEFGFSSSARRELGYRDVLADAGIPIRPEFVRYVPHDRVAAQRAAAELLALDARPTAIFAASDVQASGVLEACRSAGIGVPHEVSVVGFDDVEMSSYIGLTTVRQPLYESGRLGAELLLDALAHGEVPAPKEHRLSLELIERRRPRRHRGQAEG